ncbi:hypothetical protein PAXRUDRAFT_834028 [Paxillus rubicundulus Ve08.2h10]|uniref:Protein CPL1-like domain-containing protein n=1 Tax=Paxillus rubicundulus Ve08.2h10 TaxID=930991 RepID=A0A0D0DF16_9AGAM|nr:hypothetical protein PAXRUDRAFT_834028 [Paxillus rubicundulus Ve08.2h10]
MRLTALATPLLLASASFAGSPQSRAPHRRAQHTDVCANIDADLVFPDVIIDGKAYVAGQIDIGLCVSQVTVFVGHYNVTEAAVKVVGKDKVESTVVAMIKKAGVECSYPQHAKPSVTHGDACDFVCTDGFLAMPTKNPTSCQCPPHLMVCDGKCGHYHLDCHKAAPPSRRRSEPKCAEGLTMCGVPDATWGQAYKCTNITSDSFTCGGCVKSSPFGSSSTSGVNCHDIPNVDDVTCKGSSCFVNTCKSGFMITPANDGCIPRSEKNFSRGSPAPNADAILASTTEPGHGLKVARDGPSEAIAQAYNIDGTYVSRSSPASGVISYLLSTGNGDSKPKVLAGIPADSVVSRTFAPLKGLNMGVVTSSSKALG